MEASKYWFVQQITMRSTTESVKVSFVDMGDNFAGKFQSNTIELEAPSANAGNVSYAFSESASY